MEWISVKDRLPETPVLIYSKGYYHGNSTVAFVENGNWYIYHCRAANEPILAPTHWMPLPAPPET
jgi:hypothetical protein